MLNGTMSAVGIVILAATAGLAQGPNPQPDKPDFKTIRTTLDERYPPVPAEMWKAYVAAIKEKPEYKVYRALAPEEVGAAMDTWSKELGVELRATWTDWLATNTTKRRLPAGPWRALRVEDESDYWQGLMTHVTRVEETRGRYLDEDVVVFAIEETGQIYRVEDAQLDGLRVPKIEAIRFEHPINRPLETFEAKNETLTTVVERLSSVSEPGFDYALNSGDADQIRLTLRIRDKSVIECLNVAAGVANWKLYGSRGDDVSIPTNGLESMVTGNGPVEAGGDATPRFDTPLEALRHLVFERVRATQKEKLVVRLSPTQPEPVVGVRRTR